MADHETRYVFMSKKLFIVWRGIVQIRLDDDSLAIPSGQAYAQCLMRRHFGIAHVGVH